MSTKPQIRASRTVAESRLFIIDEVDLRFGDGTDACFETIRTRAQGAVLVAPVTDDGKVLLVREYGAGVDRYEVQLPKGRIESDEDILAAANRELREECGVAAEHLREVTAVTLAPGYLGFTTHIVLARGLYEAPLPGDEPEAPAVIEWPLDGLDRLLAHPECTEARTLAALYMIRDQLAPRDDA